VVKNSGPSSINVRIQQKGKILSIEELQANKKKEFELEVGYELYFDSDGKAETIVKFSK
jgi:hypothetical protein